MNRETQQEKDEREKKQLERDRRLLYGPQIDKVEFVPGTILLQTKTPINSAEIYEKEKEKPFTKHPLGIAYSA